MKNKKILIGVLIMLAVIIAIIFMNKEASKTTQIEETNTVVIIEEDDNAINDEPVPVGHGQDVGSSSDLYFKNGERYYENDLGGLIVDGSLKLGTYTQDELVTILDSFYGDLTQYEAVANDGTITYTREGYTFTSIILEDGYLLDSITITDPNVISNFYSFIGETYNDVEEEMKSQTRLSNYSNIHDGCSNLGWYIDEDGQGLIIFENSIDDYSLCNDPENGNKIVAVTIVLTKTFN